MTLLMLLQITLLLIACARGWFPWPLLLAAIPYFVVPESGPLQELLGPFARIDMLPEVIVWISSVVLIYMAFSHRPTRRRA